MEQIKLEIQKLYKALDKLETRCDKVKNLKVDKNAKDNSDIKKEFLNLRNKVTRLIGEKSELLEDGMEVILNSFNDEVISVDLPDTIIVEILEADAVVKGQTASSSYKPAKIKNGIRILVPPHIETGTKVVIKTEDRSYVERSKE